MADLKMIEFKFDTPDEATVELIKSTKDKRSERDTRNSLENLLVGWLSELASDPDTVALKDADGNIVVARDRTDDTIFGWDYESLPQEVKDTVARRASKGNTTKQRQSRAGWLGVRNPLHAAAKASGLSLRFVRPSGENAESEPFKQSDWEDTPSYGCITFRNYVERKRKPKGDTTPEDNGGDITDEDVQDDFDTEDNDQ